jgi:hypothetical protein
MWPKSSWIWRRFAPACSSSEAKNVPERVRRHAFTLVHARRVDVVAEDLAELRVVERLALDADKDRLLGQPDAGRIVVGEERGARGWIGIVRCRPPSARRTRTKRLDRSTSSHSSPSSLLRRRPAYAIRASSNRSRPPTGDAPFLAVAPPRMDQWQQPAPLTLRRLKDHLWQAADLLRKSPVTRPKRARRPIASQWRITHVNVRTNELLNLYYAY